jgi:hypothetical protein
MNEKAAKARNRIFIVSWFGRINKLCIEWFKMEMRCNMPSHFLFAEVKPDV